MLVKQRDIPRRVYLWVGTSALVIAICIAVLGFAGSKTPPPRFKIGQSSLLTPIEYPPWQRASDWIAGRRYVLLTFDDGPYGHGVDEQILATLARHHAHAIFFEVCAHITSKTINVPREILAGGNLIGNHSYNHLHLGRLHGRALRHQVDDCSDRLKAVSGMRPRFLRPPWGQTSPEVLEVIHSAGMQQVLWNANSGDTWLKNPQKIIRLSLREVSLSRTSILLMHSRPITANALDTLLTELQHRGVRFVLPQSSACARPSPAASRSSLQQRSEGNCSDYSVAAKRD